MLYDRGGCPSFTLQVFHVRRRVVSRVELDFEDIVSDVILPLLYVDEPPRLYPPSPPNFMPSNWRAVCRFPFDISPFPSPT